MAASLRCRTRRCMRRARRQCRVSPKRWLISSPRTRHSCAPPSSTPPEVCSTPDCGRLSATARLSWPVAHHGHRRPARPSPSSGSNWRPPAGRLRSWTSTSSAASPFKGGNPGPSSSGTTSTKPGSSYTRERTPSPKGSCLPPPSAEDPVPRYTIISADGHAGGDLLDYRPYLASRWHDEFDAWAATYVRPFADLLAATAYRNWDSERR